METRRFTIDIEQRSDDDMTVIGTLSTETAVSRGGYNEILLHDKDAIDLSRAPLPLLEAHEHSRINIGIIEDIKLKGRELKGMLRFGTSARARELWNDVKAKVVRGLSIAYEVLDTEKLAGNDVLVTKWLPIECSLVSIPADINAQVGRSKQMEDWTIEQLEQELELKKQRNLILSDQIHDNSLTTGTEFRSLGHWFQAVAEAGRPGGKIDTRLHQRAPTGLGETIGADGGFLVTTQFGSDIFKVVNDSDIMGRVAKMKLSTSATSFKLPAVDETSRASTRLGGMLGYWISEADEKTASKPKFRQMEFTPNKVIVLCYLTDELLSDATMLESFIRQGFADEIRFQVEDAIVNGNGVGKPLGLLNAAAKITQDKEAGQAAASIVYENVTNMWSRLHPSVRKDAVWLICGDAEPQLWEMSLSVGTGGSAVYLPSGGASASPYSTLFGRPVIPTEHCQTLGTEGDLILFSPSQYLLVDKGTLQTDMSIHVRFVFDESCMRGVYRVDGQPLWNSALTPAHGATQSSIVTLQTRS